MRNLLVSIEESIDASLRRDFFKKREEAESTAETITQHLTLISDHILDEAVTCDGNDCIRAAVLPFHEPLTSLFNRVLEAQRKRNSSNIQNYDYVFYSQIHQQLDSILRMILRVIDKTFSPEKDVSDAYAAYVRANFRAQWEQIKKLTLEATGIDWQSFHLCSIPLHDFIEGKGTITFYQLSYLRRFVRELSQALQPGFELDGFGRQYLSIGRELNQIDMEVAPVNINLHLAMVYLNHNSKEYIKHCIILLQRKVDDQPEHALKLRILRLYEKIMRVSKPGPKTGLHPSEPPINQQMLEWISSEINFLQALEPEHENTGDDFPKSVAVAKTKRVDKLDTNLSIYELTLIARIFKDANLLSNHNTDIMRFISQHFTTKKADEPSYGSMESKWFTPKRSTIEAVQRILEDCLRSMRKFNK